MVRSLLTLCLVCLAAGYAHGEARTRATLNGDLTPVYFNDGDSFKVIGGVGTRARLQGFNTLESYGPVHQWGGWTYRELLVIAKLGTKNGQKGTWSCTSDMATDTYGRALFECPELRLSQLRKGLAHAMTVTAEPAAQELLDAQDEAKREGRGMWAHGDPEWILTSLHSHAEKPHKPYAYNRVVSSVDGHSELWRHRDNYAECEEGCVDNVTISEGTFRSSNQALRDNPVLDEIWGELSRDHRRLTLRVWLMLGSVASIVPEASRAALAEGLRALEADGTLRAETRTRASCSVYVDYKRRFGGNRAKCLK